MSTRRASAAVLIVLLTISSADAVDLAKVDRTIRREPAYRTKPKYCLLVFGPEARTRVWLVVDGETAYLDRNGDGDLTGKDEAVAARVVQGKRHFALGDVRDDTKRTHTGFQLTVEPA